VVGSASGIVRLVLLDNTVLTNFARADSIQLALDVWLGDACSTSDVLAEYQAGVLGHSLPADAWQHLPVVTLTDQERQFAAVLPPPLHTGERSCLAVAVRRHGLFASDDSRARIEARRGGIALSGSVGMLRIGVQQHMLSLAEANRLLRIMIGNGYHSPVLTLDELLSNL